MLVVVLCFAGGFAGLICVQAYDVYQARHVQSRTDTAYVAMLQFAALAFGAMVPPAALSLALHTHM